ncbi:V-type proton ATPase subunit e 1 isoform X2 [Rhineura floridana]|uniref:V-type proton ATPase subunit e 1 isoform X2 n=1 Tax=Rhineura floridana TaxID=261503 RepID=UPI002AC7F471|nr:V-type proton ATPase subunit e 1 isoform X2 [Rhineura floridana]
MVLKKTKTRLQGSLEFAFLNDLMLNILGGYGRVSVINTMLVTCAVCCYLLTPIGGGVDKQTVAVGIHESDSSMMQSTEPDRQGQLNNGSSMVLPLHSCFSIKSSAFSASPLHLNVSAQFLSRYVKG